MVLKNVAELINAVREHGFSEVFGLFYGDWEGAVYDSYDPLFLGRIKLVCPAAYQDQVFDEWAYPKGIFTGANKGIYAIPDKGDPIWVSFKDGEINYPMWQAGYTPTKNKIGDKDVLRIQYGPENVLECNRSTNTWTLKSANTSVVLDNEKIALSALKGINLSVGSISIDISSVLIAIGGNTYSAVLGEKLLEYETKLLVLMGQLNVGGFPVTDGASTPLATSPLLLELTAALSSLSFLSNKVKLG